MEQAVTLKPPPEPRRRMNETYKEIDPRNVGKFKEKEVFLYAFIRS
jgi:hypothetical protein